MSREGDRGEQGQKEDLALKCQAIPQGRKVPAGLRRKTRAEFRPRKAGMQTHRDYLFHFIWATKQRQPFIMGDIEPRLHEYIRRKCEQMNVHVYAVNGMPDHIHVACSLPTTISIGAFMKGIKGGSAHFVNHLPDVRADVRRCLYWQPGFGGRTYTERDLPHIIRYVDNQKQHHAEGTLLGKLEYVPPVPEGLSFPGNSLAFQCQVFAMPGLQRRD